MSVTRTGKRCIKCGEGEVVIKSGAAVRFSGDAPDLFVPAETPSYTQVEADVAACERCGQPYAETSTLPLYVSSNQIILGTAAA